MKTNKLLREEVTLFHRNGEDPSGRGIYVPFFLKNVRLECRNSVYASGRGLKPYDGFKLYFRDGISSASEENGNSCSYISPLSWAELDDSEKSSYWTVGENDVVTPGICTEVPNENCDLDQIKATRDTYYVNSVIPCRSDGTIKLIEITGRGRSVESE